jgi:GH15 family glucan-1,4-alpha-glucosidase
MTTTEGGEPGAVRLEDLALLGDLESAALLTRHGDLVWLCLPRFDSPAVLASLLGGDEHGHWSLRPADPAARPMRRYLDDSLVVETVWDTLDGQVRVLDLMPTQRGAHPDVVRIVEGIRGRVPMTMKLCPRFGYGQVAPWLRRTEGGVVATSGPDTLLLRTDLPLQLHAADRTDRTEASRSRGTPDARSSADGAGASGHPSVTTSSFTVGPGQRSSLVLTWHPSDETTPARVDATRALEDTLGYWADWHRSTQYSGNYQGPVRRSLSTVKALTYGPTGGIMAAPTMGLPESVGGVRNWDYRYCWLRDASFALRALLDTGHRTDARAWRDWLLRAASGDPAQLQILYGPAGERHLPEWQADWLPGYAGSSPVRVGNAARGQFQLDVYGEVVTALHQSRTARLPGDPAGATWDLQKALTEHVETVWDQPDQGLWETRGKPAHYVHSKVLAWAALDRAAADADQLGLDEHAGVPVARWRHVRDQVRADVLARGFDTEQNTFVREYGSRQLDGALLRLPLLGFVGWDDPRAVGTVDAVARELRDDGLIRRYVTDDGLAGREGAFLACSFWLAQCRAHLGQLSAARDMFDRLLSLRNDLGLLAEEYDTTTGAQVGNFPQAFSHVPLITTALTLDEHDVLHAVTGNDPSPTHSS